MLEENDEIVEYVYGPTPNGGVRAEAHYLNVKHEYAKKELAEIIIIKEFDADGDIIIETIMNKNEEKLENEDPRKSR